MNLLMSATFAALFLAGPSFASQVALTMDDPAIVDQGPYKASEIDDRIRATLAEAKTKAALFVCGKRVDSEDGKALLARWDTAGHLIGNHSYSHAYYHAADATPAGLIADIERGEKVVAGLTHFKRYFRFPFLKEGDTVEKRDSIRAYLGEHGYRNGSVTIDASDWAIDARLVARIKKDPRADLKPYRDFYLKHIWERATYYDTLAREVLGHEIRHTLLIHHSLLNALFLKDLIAMFRSKGWTLIDAAKAFEDPVFLQKPATLPAGESLVWSLAKQSGRYEGKLRYPGEDDTYEKPEMDRLGL